MKIRAAKIKRSFALSAEPQKCFPLLWELSVREMVSSGPERRRGNTTTASAQKNTICVKTFPRLVEMRQHLKQRYILVCPDDTWWLMQENKSSLIRCGDADEYFSMDYDDISFFFAGRGTTPPRAALAYQRISYSNCDGDCNTPLNMQGPSHCASQQHEPTPHKHAHCTFSPAHTHSHSRIADETWSWHVRATVWSISPPKLCSMCCTTICTHTQAKANRLKNWSQKYDMKKTYSADLMTQWDCKICMADSYFQLELPLYTSCCTALHTWAQSICLSVSYTLMSLPVELSLASWPTPVHSASPSLPSFICGTFLLSR